MNPKWGGKIFKIISKNLEIELPNLDDFSFAFSIAASTESGASICWLGRNVVGGDDGGEVAAGGLLEEGDGVVCAAL